MASAAIAAALGVVPGVLGGILNSRAQGRVASNQVDLLNYYRQLVEQAIGPGGMYSQNWDPARDAILNLLQNPNRAGSPTSQYQDLATQFQDRVSGTNFLPTTVTGTTQENINNLNSTLARSQDTYDTLSQIIGNQGFTGESSNIIAHLLGNATGGEGTLPFLRDFVTETLGNRGQTAENQTLLQRLVDVANAGGATGVTQGLQGAGSSLLERVLSGQPTNSLTAGLLNTGNNLLSNYGSTAPLTQQLANNGQQLFTSAMASTPSGNTPGLDQLRQNGQGLFDYMIANGGVVNDFFAPAFGQGLSLLQNAGQLDPVSQALLQAAGGIGAGLGSFHVGAAPSPSSVESGRTDLTSYLADRMRGIYSGTESPLLSMDRMQSMARDTAGNAQAGLLYNAMEQAANRGAIPGSSLGGGALNRFLLENSNTIAREMAQASNQAALTRQALGLQERGQADQLGLGIAGAENQRYAANVSRANSIDNDAVQRYLGELSASTSGRNAGLAAQAQLLSALSSSSASRYNTAVSGGAGLLNSVLGNTSTNFNTNIGNALQSLLGAEQVDANRFNTSTQARSQDLSTALQSILGAGNQQVSRDSNLLSTVLPFLSNVNTNEVTNTNNLGTLAHNLFQTASTDELGRLAAYGSIGGAADNRTLQRLMAGLQGNEQFNSDTLNFLNSAGALNTQASTNLMNALSMRGTTQGQDANLINLIQQMQGGDFARQRQGTQDTLNAYLQSIGLLRPLMDQERENTQFGINALAQMANGWRQQGAQFGLQNPFGNQSTPTTSAWTPILAQAGSSLSDFAQSLLNNRTTTPNITTPPFVQQDPSYRWTNNIQFPTFTNPFSLGAGSQAPSTGTRASDILGWGF